jgi:hypothetical protein
METTETNKIIKYHEETVMGIMSLIRIINDLDLSVYNQSQVVDAINKLKKQGKYPEAERPVIYNTELKEHKEAEFYTPTTHS